MNLDTVNYLANLARLEIPEGEKEKLAKDLENILGFVDEIQGVEITESDQKKSEVNVFREDVVNAIQSDQNLVEASAMHQDNFVKVPKVI